MNIKIPKGIKSPTVVIIGQGTMAGDEKMNKMHEKRMDMLEKKLGQQYKSFIDKTDYLKTIERLQGSFMNNFNKMLLMNKTTITQANSQKVDLLRKEFGSRIKQLSDNSFKKESDVNIKSFTTKLTSLESAIKNITLKPSVRVINNTDKTLFNSFNGILYKLENLIKESKPRLIPSPS